MSILSNNEKKIEVRPVKAEEKQAMELVINRSFSKDPSNPTRQGFFNQFQYRPLARSEFFWGVFVDQKPVAGLMLVPFELSVCNMSLHLAGLTGVGTDPDHRHKGYASLLLKGVHDYLKLNGFDGAVLHSAADQLYIKNGYEPCFLEWKAKIPWSKTGVANLQAVIASNPDYECHIDFLLGIDLTRDIAQQLVQIRNESVTYNTRPVKTLRSVDYFYTSMQRYFAAGMTLVALYRQNHLHGYLIFKYDGEILHIGEFYSRSNTMLDRYVLINEILRQLDSTPKMIELIYFKCDNVTETFVEECNGTYDPFLFTNNMATLFHPIDLLQRSQGIYSIRLADSSLRGTNLSLTIQIENDFCQFLISNYTLSLRKLSKIEFDQLKPSLLPANFLILTTHEFCTAFFGYVPVQEIFDEKMTPLSEENKKFVLLLFPELNPAWEFFDQY